MIKNDFPHLSPGTMLSILLIPPIAPSSPFPRRMSAPARISPKTAALILAIVALLWTAKNFWALRVGWESRNWPKAPASIVESSFAPRMGMAHVRIAYHYTVGGRIYTGSNYDSFGPARGRQAINQFIRFRPDKGFEASYSPSDPALSLMVPGFQMRHVLVFISCLLLWYYTAHLIWKATKRTPATS